VFRLGFLANFLSKPILIGFVGGLALDIMVSQVAKMLGVSIDSAAEFGAKLVSLIGGLSGLSLGSVLIAAGAVALLLVGRRFARTVPWALIVLVAATVVVSFTDLEDAGVAVLGAVEAGPPTVSWPMLDLGTWIALVPSALALTLVTTAEGLLVARSYAEKSGVRIHPNRDLLAFGAANVAAGVSGSFAVGSSTSRTAAMDQAGSRTQLPTLVVAAGTLLLLLFGTTLLENIPLPAIGAVVAVAILPLLGIPELRVLWHQDRFEFLIGAVCFLATLFIGAIPGIFIALVLALLNVAKRAANPPIDVLAANGDARSALVDAADPGAPTAPGVLIVRVSAPLFFANSVVVIDDLKRLITAQSEPVRHLILDLESVTDIDVTAADSLDALRAWLRAHGVQLGYSRVRQHLLERMRQLRVLGDEAVHATNRAALEAVTDR
jgi:MFS superfamily sulfate permease-like transporter